MPRTDIVEELTEEQIVERDLAWLRNRAGNALMSVNNEVSLAYLLRGIAKTCNRIALFYERKNGTVHEGPGRRPRHAR